MGHCDRELIITCWIPLIDADVENGCLYVIPDAHKGGILEHYLGGPSGYLVIQDEDLPETAAPIPVPVPKGGVLIMTNLTPHSSYMNNADHVRWSIDLRYQGAGAPNNVDKLPADIDPDGPEVEIACYPPEADFVLRSPSHPESEVGDWKHLKKIRDDYFAGHKDLRVGGHRWKCRPVIGDA
jgi:phytanoyl-CoA hydroxylase